nr:tail assembly protein [bacterium]
MNVEKYIRIPYLDRGRDESGCDCWGLVRLVLENEFGKTLPDLDYESAEIVEDRLFDVSVAAVDAEEVKHPENGDVVLIRGGLLPQHIGVFVDGQVLHTAKGMGTVCERLSSPRLRGRIKGYYRVA